MYVADQLLMRKLVELCADYMLQHLEITNCIGRLVELYMLSFMFLVVSQC